MRTIKFIIEKEFKQIFRNKMMLPIIFVMPIIQLLILSYAATFEIKNVSLGVIDMDQSNSSRELVHKFSASPFFNIEAQDFDMKKLELQMKRGDLEQIIYINTGFEEQLRAGEGPQLQIITDAINGSAANLMSYYASAIIMDFNKNILLQTQPMLAAGLGISMPYQFWYNAELDYKKYMVPGILVLLVTMIGAFLSGMNIVREKELGTIEQLNVTPIKKHQFIIGKLMPFWIIAMFDLVLGMLLAYFVFDIHIVGSVGLVFGVASVYLLAVLGLGLFISTITNTQQQAMFIAWFFMVIFIILSGLFTPVESMPDWAQLINIFNPITYLIRFMRQLMLKGSGLMDVWRDVLSIGIYAISILLLATMRYRKTS
ncbi:MAG: ABC transporter permease [Sphaerochaetaceae bacterium]